MIYLEYSIIFRIHSLSYLSYTIALLHIADGKGCVHIDVQHSLVTAMMNKVKTFHYDTPAMDSMLGLPFGNIDEGVW